MKKKRMRRVLMAALTACMMVLGALPVYAGNGGEYALDVTYDPEGIELAPTEFTLYKVGSFGRDADTGESTLVMDDAVGDYPVDISLKKDQPEDEWMESAKALADYLKAKSPDVWSETKELSGGAATPLYSELKNGLYLLVGEGQAVTMADGTKKWVEPRPMYVLILNKSAAVTIKPLISEYRCFAVRKVWNNDNREGEKQARPKSIGVEIYYGDELQETITLPDENGNWYYQWETEKTDRQWRVVEVLSDKDKKNYRVSVTTDNSAEMTTITIENTFMGPPPPPPTDDKVTTGDTFPMKWIILLMAAALIAAVITILSRRRSRSE